MKTYQVEHQLRTAGGLTVTDITEDVQEAVRQSGILDGICSVYSPHTTCSVRVNEWERGFLEDFAVLLKRLVPTEHYYAHDDWDRRTENVCEEDMEVGNGHSHCMSMLLGPAGESIPVREGELCLGQWQRLSRSRSSSRKSTRCHWPRQSSPSRTGIDSPAGPRSMDMQCEWPLPTSMSSSQTFSVRRSQSSCA